ncbi:MAG: GYD domain-containing protein [Hyphomicrobiales bacterium]|nr:GYD domain-containing protein [Hyphomicrobiales bacterium]MBV8443772.1 GYD domain-containing protein [Hyphomicrobiales bacterium]
MPTYVTLANFTGKGLHDIKDTVKRADAFKAAAASHGAHVREFLWTQGVYDMVCVIETPDDTTMSALTLNALKLGNLKGQTSRAFPSDKVLAMVA